MKPLNINIGAGLLNMIGWSYLTFKCFQFYTQDVIIFSILVIPNTNMNIFFVQTWLLRYHIVIFWTLCTGCKEPSLCPTSIWHFCVLCSSGRLYLWLLLGFWWHLSPLSRSGGHSLCGLLAALSRSPPHVLLRHWLVRVSDNSSQP